MSSPERRSGRDSSRRSENLALLYQGLLTGIVRMQAGRQHIADGEAFRKRTTSALSEVERDAAAAGYDGADVRETQFAVVAFLDSVVLNSSEPIRAEWVRRPLQEELFGQTDAGVVFFEKLERLRSRRDSQDLADVLEVFLLCILLGFEGRYSGGLRGELYSIEEKTRARIEDIRGKARRISPLDVPVLPASETSTSKRQISPYLLIIPGAVLFTIFVFIASKLNLVWTADQIRTKLF